MKNTFNELHQWVIQNWIEAQRLEDTINEVREKHEAVCKRVIQAVQAEKPELDNCRPHPKEGHLSFARTEWSTQSDTWPPGLWIWNISFDHLTANDNDAPCAALWLRDPRGKRFDLDKMRGKTRSAALEFVKGEQPKYKFDDEGGRDVLLWYDITETRQELLQMLLDDQSEKFVQCIVSHVMILTQFIPVLNDILLTKQP